MRFGHDQLRKGGARLVGSFGAENLSVRGIHHSSEQSPPPIVHKQRFIKKASRTNSCVSNLLFSQGLSSLDLQRPFLTSSVRGTTEGEGRLRIGSLKKAVVVVCI